MEKLFVVNLRKQHEEEIALYEFLKNPDKSLFVTTEHVIEYLKPKLNSKNVISDKTFQKLGAHEIYRYNNLIIENIIFYNLENMDRLDSICKRISYPNGFENIYIFYGAEQEQYQMFKYIKENRGHKYEEEMIANFENIDIKNLLINDLTIKLIVI